LSVHTYGKDFPNQQKDSYYKSRHTTFSTTNQLVFPGNISSRAASRIREGDRI